MMERDQTSYIGSGVDGLVHLKVYISVDGAA
jgi:hypothetical protein